MTTRTNPDKRMSSDGATERKVIARRIRMLVVGLASELPKFRVTVEAAIIIEGMVLRNLVVS